MPAAGERGGGAECGETSASLRRARGLFSGPLSSALRWALPLAGLSGLSCERAGTGVCTCKAVTRYYCSSSLYVRAPRIHMLEPGSMTLRANESSLRPSRQFRSKMLEPTHHAAHSREEVGNVAARIGVHATHNKCLAVGRSTRRVRAAALSRELGRI